MARKLINNPLVWLWGGLGILQGHVQAPSFPSHGPSGDGFVGIGRTGEVAGGLEHVKLTGVFAAVVGVRGGGHGCVDHATCMGVESKGRDGWPIKGWSEYWKR